MRKSRIWYKPVHFWMAFLSANFIFQKLAFLRWWVLWWFEKVGDLQLKHQKWLQWMKHICQNRWICNPNRVKSRYMGNGPPGFHRESLQWVYKRLIERVKTIPYHKKTMWVKTVAHLLPNSAKTKNKTVLLQAADHHTANKNIHWDGKINALSLGGETSQGHLHRSVIPERFLVDIAKIRN